MNRMRFILVIALSLVWLCPKAQTHLPLGQVGFTPWVPFADSTHQKWQLSRYAGFSAGTIFGAGSASFFSMPVGLQLSRPLNKNLYAFTGVYAVPVFFSANRLFTPPVYDPSGRLYPTGNGLGLNARVEAGLMYVNDAKTFSISGSIGVERGSYPVYPAARPVTKKQ